jgi:arylsulfatase A-like enzyme
MREEDPTIASVLEAQGYATGQFGKNHLGDRDEHLPTNHGFDEFFGNLYHLNAEEEPENEDYPGDMVLRNGKTFQEQYGPRGVIHSWAGDGKAPPAAEGGELQPRPGHEEADGARRGPLGFDRTPLARASAEDP